MKRIPYMFLRSAYSTCRILLVYLDFIYLDIDLSRVRYKQVYIYIYMGLCNVC